jgi:hypothetical protein
MAIAASPQAATESAVPPAGPPARWIGRASIAILWLAAAYLLVYTFVVVVFGSERLYRILGSETYNALIAGGGLGLLALLVGKLILWGPPAAAAFLLTRLCLRLLRARPSRLARRCLLAAGTLTLPLLLDAALLDGWQGTVLSRIVGHDTEYAPHYSSWGFWQVRPGMSESDVRALAGEPLERYAIPGPPPATGWRWTRSPHSGDYRVRVVVFRAGKVSKKLTELYLD